MAIKILHMFGDIMNLYGEYANVRVFEKYLTDIGQSVQLDTLSLYEDKDISGYDFYYMGSGTEKNQKLALSQLMKYKQPLIDECNSNKVILFTGNAFEMLGEKITDANGNEYEALGFGNFKTIETTKRITGDCLAKADYSDLYHVGFINKCSKTTGIDNYLFTMSMGCGNDNDNSDEGFRINNTFGTHITGPIIVKNPHFMEMLAQILLLDKDLPKIQNSYYEYMKKSYNTTVTELKKRLENQE